MFEAHPFLTLIGCLAILTVFAARAALDEVGYGILFAIIVIVWSSWAGKIPDTPEEIAEKELKIAKVKEKETPREMSKAVNTSLHAANRQPVQKQTGLKVAAKTVVKQCMTLS